MHSQIFLAATMSLLLFGCSNKSKTPSAAAVPAPTTEVVQLKLPTPAPQKNEIAPKNEVACEREQEVRTLRVEGLQPKGCNLWYSSHSSVKPIAWSTQANTHCEQVRSNIRQKLEDAGFKCSDSITTSSALVKTVASPIPAATATPAPAASATPAKAVAAPTPAVSATPAKAVVTPTTTASPAKSTPAPTPAPVASPNKAATSPTPTQTK